jgi:hypothetical protein
LSGRAANHCIRASTAGTPLSRRRALVG